MVEAFDRLGQVVYVSYVDDCCENKGGYWCQVYCNDFLDYEIDDFCIHPEDCDCSDGNAVAERIRQYVSEQEYDKSAYYAWIEQFDDEDK